MPKSVIILLLSIISVHVLANYRVRVQIESFSNPDHRLANGTCCDLSDASVCADTCDERLVICLREADHPANDTDSQNCSLLRTSNLGVNPRGVILSEIAGPWPQDTGIQSLFTISDRTSGNIIDEIFAHINATANAPLTESRLHVGGHGRITVSFRFQVLCAADFYGPDCDTHCVGQDDDSAHLGCDEDTGSFVCLPGYRNLTSSCTDCELAEGCSEDGGFCVGPSECMCRDGYSGDNCTIGPTTVLDLVSSTMFITPTPSPTPQSSSDSLFSTPSSIDIVSSPTQIPSMPTPSPSIGSPLLSTENTFSSTSPPSIISSPLMSTVVALVETTSLALPPGRSTSAGVIAGTVIGAVGGLVLIIVLALVLGFALLVLWKRHQHLHSATRGRHWYMTENTPDAVAEEDSNTIAVRYISRNNGGQQTIPPGYRNGLDSMPEVEMKSIHQIKKSWFSEPDQVNNVNLTFDKNSVFSDSSFETVSKHSTFDIVSDKVVYSEEVQADGEDLAVSDKVMYSEVVRARGEDSEEESDEEPEGKNTNTKEIMYADIGFQADQ